MTAWLSQTDDDTEATIMPSLHAMPVKSTSDASFWILFTGILVRRAGQYYLFVEGNNYFYLVEMSERRMMLLYPSFV